MARLSMHGIFRIMQRHAHIFSMPCSISTEALVESEERWDGDMALMFMEVRLGTHTPTLRPRIAGMTA